MEEKVAKQIEQDDRNAIHWVLSTEQGRRFLWRLVSHCGIYQGIAGDDQSVYRALGRREVGLHVLGELSDIDEEKVFTMMREAKNRAIEQEIINEREKRDKRDEQGQSDRDILAGYEEHLNGGHEAGGGLPEADYGGSIL